MVTPGRSWAEREGPCPQCRRLLKYRVLDRGGWGDEGFLYCDPDQTILKWSYWGAFWLQWIERLNGPSKPWTKERRQAGLSERVPRTFPSQGEIEQSLRPCPCGGSFLYDNRPRCPNCGADISSFVEMLNRRGPGKPRYSIEVEGVRVLDADDDAMCIPPPTLSAN